MRLTERFGKLVDIVSLPIGTPPDLIKEVRTIVTQWIVSL